LKDIKSDIMRLEKQTEGALAEILEWKYTHDIKILESVG
jgi:hypothetical protein